MRIAIISDTHDNLANLEKFLVLVGEKEVNGIIHCGDVTTPETLEWLAGRFEDEIKVVCGNMEIRREEFAKVAKRHKNLEVFAEVGKWRIPRGQFGEKINLAFVHKPDKAEELARPPAGGVKYDFVFYGHTHRPWVREVGGVTIANPGTLGGVFTEATFAVLDTEIAQLELVRPYR